MNMTTINLHEANVAVAAAKQELTAAHNRLRDALDALVSATAADAAQRNVPYAKFVRACAENARSASATNSGGGHAPYNVAETLTRDAWLDVATCHHTAAKFKENQQ
jgi:hypothetical protein